jgi:hypothetical protein
VLAHAFDGDGNVDLDSLETITVTGTKGTATDTIQVTITPGDTTYVTLFEIPAPLAARDEHERRAFVREESSRGSADWTNPASLASLFRQENDVSAVWRVVSLVGENVTFAEVLGSEGFLQSPVVSPDVGGVRYVAFTSNEEDNWDLYVQRLENWAAVGETRRIQAPGSSQNFDCNRKVFHPRWVTDASGALRLLVTMTDCPDNAFEDFGFDDDPWDLGEFNIWEVDLSLMGL